MIKVTIKDRDALQGIKIEQFKTYLTNKSWYKKDNYKKMFADGTSKIVAELWSPGIGAQSSAVIVVPNSEKFADYIIRMAENMMALERIEKRSQLEIYVDIIQKALIIQPTKITKVKRAKKPKEESATKRKVATKKR